MVVLQATYELEHFKNTSRTPDDQKTDQWIASFLNFADWAYRAMISFYLAYSKLHRYRLRLLPGRVGWSIGNTVASVPAASFESTKALARRAMRVMVDCGALYALPSHIRSRKII
jgi:hypothetical protein